MKPKLMLTIGGIWFLIEGITGFFMGSGFDFSAFGFSVFSISRVLAVIGILTGVAGLANYLVIKMDGGSWSAPNDPAHLPAIMGTYLAFVLGYVIWAGWTSGFLLKSSRQ